MQRISGLYPSSGYNEELEVLKEKVSELENETENIEGQEEDEIKNISHLSKRIRKLEQDKGNNEDIEEIKDSQKPDQGGKSR